jgi:hypothetical protein
MDEMAEPRGLRGYLAGENDGPGGESQTQDQQRAAFLGGEGTLTWREVIEWARELGYPGHAACLTAMMSTDPMMVSVVRGGGR